MSTPRYTSKKVGKPAAANKPAPEMKRKPFAIRMRPSIFEAGQKAAKLQNRSLASLMETLLILHLREQDLLPEDYEIEMRQLELRSSARGFEKLVRGGRSRP